MLLVFMMVAMVITMFTLLFSFFIFITYTKFGLATFSYITVIISLSTPSILTTAFTRPTTTIFTTTSEGIIFIIRRNASINFFLNLFTVFLTIITYTKFWLAPFSYTTIIISLSTPPVLTTKFTLSATTIFSTTSIEAIFIFRVNANVNFFLNLFTILFSIITYTKFGLTTLNYATMVISLATPSIKV